MRHLLLTGFAPYGSGGHNPSAGLALSLDGVEVDGLRIVGRILPVSFERARAELTRMMAIVRPVAVLSMGLAPDRTRVTVETVARGERGERVDEDGAPDDGPGTGTRSLRQPLDGLLRALDAAPSDDAGAFVCNRLAWALAALPVPAAFVHVPWEGVPRAKVIEALRLLAAEGSLAR